MGTAAAPPALELKHISKAYGPVVANRDVSLRIERQTIHAVIGENGAGKSTLMKIAYGHAPADAGEIWIKGEHVARHAVPQSIKRGVGMVHQHFMLVGPLTVAENVVLGQEPIARGMVDLGRAERELRALSERYGLDVDPLARVEDLSVGQQQRVEIIKVLWRGSDVIILDEPTAVLTPGEVRDLFRVLRQLVADGSTVVLITHKLDEVLAIATRVTVMRRGEHVAEFARDGLSAAQLVQAMVGRPVDLELTKPPAARGDVVLEVRGIDVMGTRGLPALHDVSLQVRAGEILGIAGIEGNGQTELVEAIVGLRGVERGSVVIHGRDVTREPVHRRYAVGLSHIPEDRHDRALVLEYSVRDNLILGQQRDFTGRAGILDRGRVTDHAGRLIEQFDVRPPDPAYLVGGMSGGNQQKVVVARELSRRALSVLICAQPTRGVDIGAIEAIHRRILDARARGLAVLLLSAELNELRTLSDRLIVLHKGEVVSAFTAEQLAGQDVLDDIGTAMMCGRQSSEAARGPEAVGVS